MRSFVKIMVGVGTVSAVCAIAWPASAQTVSPYTMPVPAARENGPNPGGTIQAPPHSDNTVGQDEISLTPPPPVSPLQQMVKEKKSWSEMTPEEMLGLDPAPTSDNAQTLGSKNQNSRRSPLQDLLLSQQHPGQLGADEQDAAVDKDWGFLEHNTLQSDQKRLETMPGATSTGSLFSHLLENAQGGFSREYSDSEWQGVFRTPTAVAPTPAQQADMQAFQDLLNPTTPEEGRNNSTAGARLPAAQSPVDPLVEPVSAKYNPNGGSFLPLEDAINRPKRLTALPAATSSGGYKAPYVRPSWAPQPPPWTLTTPQLFVEPQRKF